MDKLEIVGVVVLGILAVIIQSEAQKPTPHLNIFKKGKYPTKFIQVDKTSSSLPPFPLRIYSPNEIPGTFDVLLFLHAACLENSYYSTINQFVATHGHIVVAPQLYKCQVFGNPISGPDEVENAAKVINWLSSSLQSLLPSNAKADLTKLTLGGHGRGGKTSFAIALGHSPIPLSVQAAALIAVDPVAGTSRGNEDEPKILTFLPRSFDLTIPKTIIGARLGNESICWVCPSCAPNDMNHEEFYRESKAPVSHIVAKDYGHVDLLDDDLEGTMGFIAEHKCVNGPSNKEPFRTAIAGVMTAFLNAYFGSFDGDYKTILHRPIVAPVTLLRPDFLPPDYAQI